MSSWPLLPMSAVRRGCHVLSLDALNADPSWDQIIDWLANSPPLHDIKTFWVDDGGVRRLLITGVERMHAAVDKAMNIAHVALLFGETERATLHPDGRPETDTTHTSMLGLIAIEFAPAHLDLGKVIAYAQVHDLPEYHPNVGDTCTAWGLSSSERDAKAQRERWAVDRLRELGLTRIVALIEEYEAQTTPEARWVRLVDKICPKLTHLLNEGLALRAIGMTRADMLAKHAEQRTELAQAYPEQTQALDLFDAVCLRCESLLTDECFAGPPPWQAMNEEQVFGEFQTALLEAGAELTSEGGFVLPDTPMARETAKILSEIATGIQPTRSEIRERIIRAAEQADP